MTQSFQSGGRPGRVPTDAFAKVFESVDLSLYDLFRPRFNVTETWSYVIPFRTFLYFGFELRAA